MKEYVTVSSIRATPEMVWKVLTDATGYADWNPEIVGIDGRIALNERITARVRLGSGSVRRVPMRVTAFETPSRMEWTGGYRWACSRGGGRSPSRHATARSSSACTCG